MDLAIEAMEKDYNKYWITAKLDIPQEHIVQGEIECHQD